MNNDTITVDQHEQRLRGAFALGLTEHLNSQGILADNTPASKEQMNTLVKQASAHVDNVELYKQNQIENYKTFIRQTYLSE